MQRKSLMGDIFLRQDKNLLAFGNEKLELTFSLQSGHWVGCKDLSTGKWCVGNPDLDQPTLLLRLNGERTYPGVVRNSRVYDLEGALEIGTEAIYKDHQTICLDREVTLEISAQEGEWILTSIFRLSPQSDTFSRDLRLTYLGQDEVLLRDIRMIIPQASVGEAEGTFVEAPDYAVKSHFPFSELPQGIWEGLDSRTLTEPGRVQHSVDAPGSVVGLVALHHPQSERSFLCWPHSTSEYSIMELLRENGHVNITHWLFLADRFTNGHTVEAGRQVIRLTHGNWEDAMQRFQRWYETIGLRVPKDRPEWCRGIAIYEVHVGNAPFKENVNYKPYPTVADLTEDLTRIADMGFEVIQVMPHWPFCGYTVHDYYDIDVQYGDEDQLKAMVLKAHGLGLKVILDVVLHGCADKEIIRWDMEQYGSYYDFIFNEWLQVADERSRYRDEHPEWFMRDEQGEVAKVYTWAFDPANRSYQDFMIDVLKHYISDLGVDGFRFDAPTWNCMPNWDRELPYRASASYYGSYHLLMQVRKAIKEFHPDTLLYTEPSGPLFRHSMDVNYNYDAEWLTGSLMEVISERGFAGSRMYGEGRINAKDIARWLHYQRLTLPRDSITVQHLDSHDTFWWGELAQFRHEAFGIEASRALFAMFALQGGGIMNYVGAERGSEAFYRRLLHLRQNNPVLRYGDCDFLAIECRGEMVLPLLRTHEGDHAIPVINLTGEDVEVTIGLPTSRLGFGRSVRCTVMDLFNEEDLDFGEGDGLPIEALQEILVKLPAYGVRILQIQPIKTSE
jgi:glycosidase